MHGRPPGEGMAQLMQAPKASETALHQQDLVVAAFHLHRPLQAAAQPAVITKPQQAPKPTSVQSYVRVRESIVCMVSALLSPHPGLYLM